MNFFSFDPSRKNFFFSFCSQQLVLQVLLSSVRLFDEPGRKEQSGSKRKRKAVNEEHQKIDCKTKKKFHAKMPMFYQQTICRSRCLFGHCLNGISKYTQGAFRRSAKRTKVLYRNKGVMQRLPTGMRGNAKKPFD